MFDLTFLGTSASVPSVGRNQSALLVSAGRSRVLIDCGEGTQRQLLRSGAGFRRLGRMLLTHAHLDHMLGLPGLLSTMGLQRSAEAMTIHGGQHTLEAVSNMLAGLWGEGRAPIALAMLPVTDGAVIEEDGFAITAFPVRHGDSDSYGYVFESPARRRLRPDRLAALRIPDGAVRKDLANGRPVTLPDGRKIDPDDVLGPPVNGRKLAVIGDVETTDGLGETVRDADILVIESTFRAQDQATARDYGHLTAAEAASFARSAGVGRLILTHISGRYPAEDILAEAQAIFPATQVANDLDRFTA